MIELEIDWNYNSQYDKRIQGRINSHELKKILKTEEEILIKIFSSKKSYKGILENISAGGLQFLCQGDFNVKQNIKLIFKLDTRIFVLYGELIHKTNTEQTNTFQYGVHFKNISLRDIEMLKGLYIESISYR